MGSRRLLEKARLLVGMAVVLFPRVMASGDSAPSPAAVGKASANTIKGYVLAGDEAMGKAMVAPPVK